MALLDGNILANIPVKLGDEQFIELLSVPNLRIERIVSADIPAGEVLLSHAADLAADLLRHRGRPHRPTSR